MVMSCALHCMEINYPTNELWPENFCTSHLTEYQMVVGVDYDCLKIQIVFELHL